MSEHTYPMCARWSLALAKRRAIVEFLEWAAENEDVYLTSSSGATPRGSDLLDEYYEIDRAELDRERRAILEANAD